jgi:hypothetical protein
MTPPEQDLRLLNEMAEEIEQDPKDWRHKSRGVVLGTWHQLKLQLYYQAMDASDEKTATNA